jgi:RNA polymerase sigma-70 factor (ECF subfamily)
MRGLLEAGRAAWPTLRVSDAAFGDYAAERGLNAGADWTPEGAADLYLACACTHRIPGAVEAFLARFDREVRLATARVDSSHALYDEVKQTLAETLFVGADSPRIAQFSGRGPLGAWVGIAARRIAGRLRRNARAASALDEEAVALEAMGVDADPAMQYLKERYGNEVRAALVEAFATLEPRDRTTMRLIIVDKLSMEEVGRIFGVSQSTISRQADRIRKVVMTATRRALRDKLGASAEEIESLIKMVQSQVEVSFSRILT